MADKVWKPMAADIADIWKIAVGGTWADTETLTITVADQDLVITLGATDITNADIAEKIHNAINASDYDDGIQGAETRNTGGLAIPQMAELKATYVAAATDVYLVGPIGVPVTVTVDDSDSSSGTLTLTHEQTATGKHFWDNATNWASGTVPVGLDDVWFEDTDIDCLYGLPTGGAFELQSIHVLSSFRGRIGLPQMNRSSPSRPYPEYRQRFVILGNTTSPGTIITIGEGPGAGPLLVNIDNEAGASTTLNVLNTGPRPSPEEYVVNYKASSGGNMSITGASSVAVSAEPGDSGQLDTLYMGEGGPTVWLGEGLSNNDMIVYQYSGSLLLDNGPNQYRQYGGTSDNYVGFRGGSVVFWVMEGATSLVRSLSGATSLTSVKIAGTVDFSRMLTTGTMAVCDVFAGYTIRDPGRLVTWTAGIQHQGCKPSDGVLDINHVRLTPAAIS